jgi:hypothetical protein
VKVWEKTYQANGPPNQAGIAILISDNMDFKPKLLKKDKEGHFILIKGAIHQEEIIINLQTSIVGAPNFIKHTLTDLKTQIDPNTEVVGDFSTPLSLIGHPDQKKKKTNKEILKLNDTINLMDLTEVSRVFHPATAQYTFFSAALETFSKVDHILGHKTSLNKFKKTEITPCIPSDHNGMKLELNNKRSCRIYSNNCRLNNTLFNY